MPDSETVPCSKCQKPTRTDDPGGAWLGWPRPGARWICADCAFWLWLDDPDATTRKEQPDG